MKNSSILLESIRASLPAAMLQEGDLRMAGNLPGGDINQAGLISCGSNNWFLKYHPGASSGMFVTEALALEEISAQSCIRVPAAVALGQSGDTAWLLLEYLEFTSKAQPALLGEQLAALHCITAERYGWSRNNFIGTTPQDNTYHDNWAEFWRDCRLQPQLTMLENRNCSGRLLHKGERLLTSVEQLLRGHQPDASLLHGDLWAGNKAYVDTGQPVIFDPASYYGDRETDIAMTELFGGFEPAFYAAYEERLPLSSGYGIRRELYNLYHMLNHLNLFGGGYLGRCESMLDKLLAQLG